MNLISDNKKGKRTNNDFRDTTQKAKDRGT